MQKQDNNDERNPNFGAYTQNFYIAAGALLIVLALFFIFKY